MVGLPLEFMSRLLVRSETGLSIVCVGYALLKRSFFKCAVSIRRHLNSKFESIHSVYFLCNPQK